MESSSIKIGSKGQGPEEYLQGLFAFGDWKNKVIICSELDYFDLLWIWRNVCEEYSYTPIKYGSSRIVWRESYFV